MRGCFDSASGSLWRGYPDKEWGEGLIRWRVRNPTWDQSYQKEGVNKKAG